MRPVRILVFAKAPQPGLAKTRLIPALGAAGAAALAHRMLDHTLASALAAGVDAVELCATPGVGEVAWRGVELPAGIETSTQGDGDLGARMARAAERSCARGEAVMLVGTDCAEMSPALLRAAAAVLRAGTPVIHPAADGGYALLGLTRFEPRVFDAIAWSSDTVAATTIARLRALGWPVHVGAVVHDIDTPADLVHLPFLRG
jgi:rSAM/selenodomain-associated transferase 1